MALYSDMTEIRVICSAPRKRDSEIKTGLRNGCIKKQEKVSNIALVIEPGNSFSKISSNTESDEGNEYQWTLTDLTEPKQITVKGIFNGSNEEKESTEMVFKVILSDLRSPIILTFNL